MLIKKFSIPSEEVKKYNIPDLIFVCEPQSNDGKEAIKELKAELDFTEYFLRYKDISRFKVDTSFDYYRKSVIEIG